MGALSSGAWRLLLTTGLAERWQRYRFRDTLTVVGLHRVLGRDDPRRLWAVPEYTITDQLFTDFVEFAAARYTFVDVDHVVDACAGRRPLPPRALLLTFDDGWADTVDVALPILRARGLPSVVFVIAGRIGSEEGLWRGELQARLLSDPAALDEAIARLVPSGSALKPAGKAAALDQVLSRLPDAERWAAVASIGRRPPSPGPQMASAAALRAAAGAGMAVGAHGFSHTPLTEVADPLDELSRARASLISELGLDPALLRAVSFPHGRYSPSIIVAAREAGFQLFLTSELTANPLTAGRPVSPLLGRLWVGQSALGTRDGPLNASAAAARFFLAPIRVPGPVPGVLIQDGAPAP